LAGAFQFAVRGEKAKYENLYSPQMVERTNNKQK